LFNAAIQDWKRRELNASAWAPIVIVGFFFLVLELVTSKAWDIVSKLTITLITLLLPYFLHLYELGDAVVIISLSIAHVSTIRPILGGFFLTTFFPDFGLTMLWNTELIMILISSLRKIYNYALGRRRRLMEEHPEDGSILSIDVEAFEKNGVDKTHFLKKEVPLVSFLLPGYVLTIFFGSIIPLPF